MGEAGVAPLTSEDYEAIEAAVQETTRGRWFLAEFARRNRQADTLQLLDAISRLDGTMRELLPRAPAARDAAPLDLARLVERVPAAGPYPPASLKPEPGPDGLDMIADNALRANGDIVRAAEHIQEIAWMLRETGTDGRICEELDHQASEIYAACSTHESAIARIRGLVQALRSIEKRVADRFADPSASSEPIEERGDLAHDADTAMIEDGPVPRDRPVALVLDDDIVSVEAPLYGEGEPVFDGSGRPAAASSSSFAAIDRMSLQDKLSRFV